MPPFRKTRLAALAACLPVAFCLLVPSAASAAVHPLDPLDASEHWTVLEVLRDRGHLDADTRFSGVTLADPPKDEVWSWAPGDGAGSRSAIAVVRQGNRSFEALIDLGARRLVSWSPISGVQPAFLQEELFSMVGEVLSHPDFLAGLARRGYEEAHLALLDCFGLPPGTLGTPEEHGRRLAHVRCSDPRGVTNSWPREIPGLTAVVDLGAREVVRVVDELGPVSPVSQVSAEYSGAAAGPPRDDTSPMRVVQPAGRGFRLDGHRVEWQRWSFHVQANPRVGTVVSVVRYDDAGDSRPVLYQGHLSEIFVPYMDPAFSWRARNFIDLGEFHVVAGGVLQSLLPGLDCPEGAAYLDMVVAGDGGRPRTTPRAVCLFERYAGDMAWRHGSDPGGAQAESRAKQDLVVRGVAVVGNYDYVLDWVFQQDGTLRVAVGATGIVESKVVPQEDAGAAAGPSAPTVVSAALSPGRSGIGAPPASAPLGGAPARDGAGDSARADAHGRFVAPHVVAVNHDHYFSFRLDLDVDGPANSFVLDRLVAKSLPRESPRRSLWVQEPTVARREHDARLDADMHRPALWRVVSTRRRNGVGYPTSYQLRPGRSMPTLLAEDDPPRRRVGFIDHELWVTPYEPDERYAAGDYPTLSVIDRGLRSWTQDDRPIADTDIVLWHTVGMQHLVRAEDWPVMPVVWHSFELRPFDFFDRNPALDLPAKP
jgi:primary-amine oxidase